MMRLAPAIALVVALMGTVTQSTQRPAPTSKGYQQIVLDDSRVRI